MTDRATYDRVLAQLREKTAVDPALTGLFGGAAGAYGGTVLSEALAQKYPAFHSDAARKAMQALVTGAGGLLGKSVGDVVNDAGQPTAAPQAYRSPLYDLDPTTRDIPTWALQAGQFLQPAVKASSDRAAPYGIDPSTRDIPPWALQASQFLQPAVKAAGDRWPDVIFGEVPGYSFFEGRREGRGLSGGLKGLGGSIGGGIAGGLLGLLPGKILAHFLGKDPNVPLINMPLSHLLGSVGGAVGATKGFQHAIGV